MLLYARIERGRVREIGLEHDLVDTDHLEHVPRPDFLEPEGAPEIVAEIFPRPLLLHSDLVRQAFPELVLHRFEREGNPARASFDQADLETGMTIEPTGNHPVAELRGIAHE